MPVTPFGAWLPDIPDFMNPGALEALNVIPGPGFYRPYNTLVPYLATAKLNAQCQGAEYFRDNNGLVSIFAGDVSSLYLLNSSAGFSNVSVSGGYATPKDELWRFAQFGNAVIATNNFNVPQLYTIGSSAQFAPLSGDSIAPTVARFVVAVRDFLVMGNISDISGNAPRRVRWSGINTPSVWTPTLANLAGEQDLFGDQGVVTGLVPALGATDCLVIMENGMWQMSFVGQPLVFQFTQIEGAKGTRAPNSVIRVGNLVYYYSDDGWMVSDGQTSQPFGTEKVDQWFVGQLDQSKLQRIFAGYDFVTRTLQWAFCDTSSQTPNQMLIYHIDTQQFAHALVNVEYIFDSLTVSAGGYNLDQLNPFGTLETLPFSLDSVVWQGSGGGRPLFAAFDTNHTLNFFTGSPLAATIDTKEAQISDLGRALVSEIWPIVDTSSVGLQIGYRDLQGSPPSFGPVTPINPIGFAPVLQDNRYHRARMTIPAGTVWTKALGVNFASQPTGQQ